ncbi:Asp23/Gls24 family envelope stress response protein [Nocardia shimofusensis]|uniref:Asp23/Gls24 family envelope stress response protein n=1 Tax=Nocardia shimofusensis TaxID=228596 RepID=UPI0008322D82|nr:Asp23/Gls24 family envelope stress response protein [Nocardia shimofusensis]
MVSPVPGSLAEEDGAGGRGNLEIRDRAVKRLAERAALDTPGVQAHAGGLDKITGRDLPRSRAVTSADRVRVWLEIAVVWPAPVATVARQVQRNVTAALGDYAGLRVDGVDVAVAQVLADESPTRSIE